MLFNSLEFLIFFPVVTIIYFLLPHRFRWFHLLLASCIFYCTFIPVYILILFFTIVIDYFAGILIENRAGKKRKAFLTASIFANVGVLAFFKYYNFFIENFDSLFQTLNIPIDIPLLNIILPIGLSFHTFQAMSYTIEVYRGNQKAERHFGIYALYVMFYPQLVAGPIERPQNLLHQFKDHHYFSSENLLSGLRLMLWGFFKKVVIADRLAMYVDPVYGDPGHYHYLNLIIATLFYAIQIYCDFSGYSDIAIGAAKSMGFDLMTNFNRPYFSTNIREFWSRWHISLSTWFKDYVYIPLGGNRSGTGRIYFNLTVVFLISGLWHGANWTFIIWGALHVVYFIIYMFSKDYLKIKFPENFFFNFIFATFTFGLVSFAWIFFRAQNPADAFLIVKHIFGRFTGDGFQPVVFNTITFTRFGITSISISIFIIALMLWVESKFSPRLENVQSKPLTDLAFCSLSLSFIIIFGVFQKASFIYFQF